MTTLSTERQRDRETEGEGETEGETKTVRERSKITSGYDLYRVNVLHFFVHNIDMFPATKKDTKAQGNMHYTILQ